jgi:hypothetical protein
MKIIKKLGKLIISSMGLRRMADDLEKRYGHPGDIIVDCHIFSWKNKKQTYYTFGYTLKTKKK